MIPAAFFGGMAVSRLNESSSRPTEHLLAWSFCIAVAAHLIVYGGFVLGQRYGWLQQGWLPAWLKGTSQVLAEIKKAQAQKPPQTEQEPPLVFVEVDPEAATQEAPKKTQYYSSRNSKAANPDVTVDTETPRIEGTQTQVPKTQAASRTRSFPLQPTPPKPVAAAEQETAEAKPKPKGGPPVGDLAMVKPDLRPGDGKADSENGDAQTAKPAPARKRPHTLAEAEAQASPGKAMKQDGGVARHLKISSLDAQATQFGQYDWQLIEAVRNHWWDLLEQKSYWNEASGKVVVQFNLLYNGDVTDVHVVESNVDEVLSYICQRAILDPKPFLPWPSDMRRTIGSDVRPVTFTFYYE